MRRIIAMIGTLVVAGLVAAAIAMTATAAAPKPKVDPGLKVFKGSCGKCHILAIAKTKGSSGPNLDDITLTKVRVVTQVTNGGHFMPAFRGVLTPKQITDVAVFVSKNAGKG